MLEPIWRCTFDTWTPHIGDPTWLGWFTVACYVATVLAVILARRQASGRERVFWTVLAVVFVFLAVNKQLDLQTFVTIVGRCSAKLQGWYADRRAAQALLIEGLAVASVILLGLLAWVLWGTLRRTGLALLGLCLTLCFVMIRAVGFHHFDHLLGVEILFMRANGWFELSGLFLVIISAVTQALRPKRTTPRL